MQQLTDLSTELITVTLPSLSFLQKLNRKGFQANLAKDAEQALASVDMCAVRLFQFSDAYKQQYPRAHHTCLANDQIRPTKVAEEWLNDGKCLRTGEHRGNTCVKSALETLSCIPLLCSPAMALPGSSAWGVVVTLVAAALLLTMM